MRNCDWCGYPMDRIAGHAGTVATSFMQGVGSVWLCRRDKCGREIERWDTDEPLSYWRDELRFVLYLRAESIYRAEQDRAWGIVMAKVAAARAETERLLGKHGQVG